MADTDATPDERRRVAHKLRCWARIPNGIIGMALMSALHTVDSRESANALAALIDPTCEVDMTESAPVKEDVRRWECRRCGHSFEDVYGAYEYCPRCGCRITNLEGGRMRYWVQCETFSMGSLKEKALKPLEEASEAREAVQTWYDHAPVTSYESGVELRDKAVYECCDTLQATCNLLAALGVSQEELDETMRDVRKSNEGKGRYA